jgi:hypothetical protein
MKQKKQKPTKRSSKYRKPLSLYGVSEKEALKDLLKSPPPPKEKGK